MLALSAGSVRRVLRLAAQLAELELDEEPEVVALAPIARAVGTPIRSAEDAAALVGEAVPDSVREKLGDDAVCVLEEECPRDGGWRNHGKYVSCVAHVAKDLRNDGTLNEDDEDGVVSDAARSDCGR